MIAQEYRTARLTGRDRVFKYTGRSSSIRARLTGVLDPVLEFPSSVSQT